MTNALLFAAQWLTRDAITLWGAKVNALIAAGQIWRLLTSSLLHTSLFHLLVRAGVGGGVRDRGSGREGRLGLEVVEEWRTGLMRSRVGSGKRLVGGR